MKYLNMENAQVEVEINSMLYLERFLKHYIEELEKLNIKRLIIKTSNEDVSVFVKTINDNINFNNISFLVMLKANLNNIPTEYFNNIILVNTSKKIYKNDNIYNQIVLKKDEIENITNALHDNINVIVEPEIDINNIKKFNDLLVELYNKNVNMEISLGGFLIPLSLIKEHPCNAYLCDGWKCGKKISQLPKVLYIDENHMIYPHKLLKPEVCIGELKGKLEEILIKYLNSQQYQVLKKIEKEVFIKYVLNYPYELFPLDKYMEWELYNDK